MIGIFQCETDIIPLNQTPRLLVVDDQPKIRLHILDAIFSSVFVKALRELFNASIVKFNLIISVLAPSY